ncbi:MAG TPA: hypothetical protein P5077_02575 [bacterium]|nr:hypothetical protein [bacterium]
MKKMVFLFSLFAAIALNAEINRPVYETGYESYAPLGNTPVLSQFVTFEDAYWLPSVLPELGKGWVYINNNGQYGGVIFPLLERKLFMHVFVEYDPNEANYTRNSPRQLVEIMRGVSFDTLGNDEYIAPLSNIFGFGFAGDVGTLSWGVNLKLYADQYSRKTTTPATTATLSNSTFRLEFTPSISMKRDEWRMDAGFNLLGQWISNETSNQAFVYPYDYAGNAEFAIYGRMMYDITKYTTLMGNLSFGYAGASDKLDNDHVSLDNTYLVLKGGALIKPVERLTLGSNFSFYHAWQGLNRTTSPGGVTTKTEDSGNLLVFNFTQTADFKPCDWFTLKAGIGKNIIVNVSTDKVIVPAGTSTNDDYDNNFDIGKFIGFAIDYKEFNFTAVMNFDVFTEGPYLLTGRAWANPMAFVASLNYQW